MTAAVPGTGYRVPGDEVSGWPDLRWTREVGMELMGVPDGPPVLPGHMVNQSFLIQTLFYEHVQATRIFIFAHVSFVLICIQIFFTAYVIFLYLI